MASPYCIFDGVLDWRNTRALSNLYVGPRLKDILIPNKKGKNLEQWITCVYTIRIASNIRIYCNRYRRFESLCEAAAQGDPDPPPPKNEHIKYNIGLAHVSIYDQISSNFRIYYKIIIDSALSNLYVGPCLKDLLIAKQKKKNLATRRRLGRRGDSSAMRSAFVVWVVCYEDYTKKRKKKKRKDHRAVTRLPHASI